MVPITRTPADSGNSKAKTPPTHLVRHADGWEVALYIAPSLQDQLKSKLHRQRQDAESSVAIRFREACKQKFPGFTLRHVYFKDLKLTPIEQRQPTPLRVTFQECTCPDENCPYCSGDNGRSHADCRNCAITR